MDDPDLAIRNLTYSRFVELGRAPTAAEVSASADLPASDVTAAWRRLHDAHALVLFPGRDEIHMANPFSAVPTPYRVEAAGRSWFGNCAWDAFGICAALGVAGTISTECADCGTEIEVSVRAEAPSDPTLLFHCLGDFWALP
ncbi:MAG: organomercurial lyase [Acidimicrobiia bacterium]